MTRHGVDEASFRSRVKPADRPDAHCPDCPFADRGDWVIYRDEYEALLRDRERMLDLLNIINVAAEYLRDPERDPAESRALAALGARGEPMSTPEERHEQFARENEEWDERIKQELETSEGHWAVGVAFWLCIAFIAWLIAGHPGVA